MALDDQDLRKRFAELRREDASRTPDFDALQTRRVTTVRPWRARAVAVAVLVLAAVLLFAFYRNPAPPAGPSIADWRSPTDFLLQTPGHELLESVPTFTRSPYGMALPQATVTPTPFVKKKS